MSLKPPKQEPLLLVAAEERRPIACHRRATSPSCFHASAKLTGKTRWRKKKERGKKTGTFLLCVLGTHCSPGSEVNMRMPAPKQKASLLSQWERPEGRLPIAAGLLFQWRHALHSSYRVAECWPTYYLTTAPWHSKGRSPSPSRRCTNYLNEVTS